MAKQSFYRITGFVPLGQLEQTFRPLQEAGIVVSEINLTDEPPPATPSMGVFAFEPGTRGRAPRKKNVRAGTTKGSRPKKTATKFDGEPPRGLSQTAWVEEMLKANHPGQTKAVDLKAAFERRGMRPESVSVSMNTLKNAKRAKMIEPGVYAYIPPKKVAK